MKRYWPVILVVTLMAAGIVSSIFTSNNSEVPNDPNIGGGILFMFGLFALIAGLIHVWATRKRNR